ncbi:hypothetical protein CRENBAI_026233 [Crenichthys baileyi]|uniref:Uncharacterized protein n=1 Tax=Crenichthys baileyi TaxID=28760 RepID=A0AAV9RL34_9TELE
MFRVVVLQKVNRHPSLQFSAASNNFASRIVLNLAPLTSFPLPAEEKHPHSMTLPPPCVTEGMVCSLQGGKQPLLIQFSSIQFYVYSANSHGDESHSTLQIQNGQSQFDRIIQISSQIHTFQLILTIKQCSQIQFIVKIG